MFVKKAHETDDDGGAAEQLERVLAAFGEKLVDASTIVESAEDYSCSVKYHRHCRLKRLAELSATCRISRSFTVSSSRSMDSTR